MKTLRKSKGERKNWKPLKEVEAVKLTAENTKGEKVNVQNSVPKKVLID